MSSQCSKCGNVERLDRRIWYHKCPKCGYATNILEEWWNANHEKPFSELSDKEKLDSFKEFHEKN
jgi:transposase